MTVSPKGSKGSAKVTTKEIREWAIGEGREVSLRGRISAEVEQAFHDAQTKKVSTKTAPVKKTAANEDGRNEDGRAEGGGQEDGRE